MSAAHLFSDLGCVWSQQPLHEQPQLSGVKVLALAALPQEVLQPIPPEPVVLAGTRDRTVVIIMTVMMMAAVVVLLVLVVKW